MYIHDISFDVYTWYHWYIRCVSVDIPSFLFLDFSAGPCCWSHSMRTRVLVIKIGLFHVPPWQLCLGIGGPQKAHFFLLPAAGGAGALLPFAAPPAAFAAASWAASSSAPCPDVSSSPPPSPQLSPPPSAGRLRRLRRLRLRRRWLLSWRCRVR